jgi:hypothetical protein
MRTPLLVIASAALVLAAFHAPTLAAEKRASVLLSAPLSINPNEGQPLCLVSNQSPTATVSVKAEIVDGTGTVAVTTTLSIPPGGIDGTTDVLTNFYSYCRVTPQDPAQLSLLRASHCIASGNTVRSCLEAR